MSESPPLLTPFVPASTPAKSAASKNGPVKSATSKPVPTAASSSDVSTESDPANAGARRPRRAKRETPDAPRPLSIGDAAALLDLETYVLRFWESEFPELRPLRTPKGQRRYAPEHIELLRRIRHLVHEKGFTLDGARRALADGSGGVDEPCAAAPAHEKTARETASQDVAGQGVATTLPEAEHGASLPREVAQTVQPNLRPDFIHEMLAELHLLRGMLSG